MKVSESYRPVSIEFDVAHDGTIMPENLGEYESAEEAAKFIGTNLVSVNQALTVARHMDFKEKTELRAEYNRVLEDKLPLLEKEWSIANQELAEAKRKEKDASEMVSATMTEVKALSSEVKRGVKEMRLDDMFTYRVCFKNRYYFYTYMDKQLKLCKISDVPEHEKGEIFNAMSKNEEFIDTNFGVNEPTKSQERPKK